jgi:hypothetical protein
MSAGRAALTLGCSGGHVFELDSTAKTLPLVREAERYAAIGLTPLRSVKNAPPSLRRRAKHTPINQDGLFNAGLDEISSLRSIQMR